MDRLVGMQVFVKVVDTGSFSAAARQLRMGQPAVSKIVAQLEERLGLPLLLRSSRSLSPTEAGQNFYEHAKLVIAQADEAELAARGAGAGLTGRLRISAPVTFARLIIVPRLSDFLTHHPQLDVELVLDDRNVDLVGEGVDVAIRMGHLTDSTLAARKLASIKRVVLATPRYFSRAGIPENPADLSRHNTVIYATGGGGSAWTFRKDGKEQSIVLKGRVRSTAAEGVREAVFADLGLGVASVAMFGPELLSGQVREALTDWALPPIDLWAIFPSGRRTTAKAHAFVTFVEKLVEEARLGTLDQFA
jgi:DNA-binding transcriptional LysR family regulator